MKECADEGYIVPLINKDRTRGWRRTKKGDEFLNKLMKDEVLLKKYVQSTFLDAIDVHIEKRKREAPDKKELVEYSKKLQKKLYKIIDSDTLYDPKAFRIKINVDHDKINRFPVNKKVPKTKKKGKNSASSR